MRWKAYFDYLACVLDGKATGWNLILYLGRSMD